jgi:hypothetical protein
MSQHQRGFAPLEGLLVVALVALVGFVGWRVFQARTASNNENSPVTTAAAADGNVDHTVDTFVKSGQSDADTTNESSDVTASTSAAAAVEGSYNESSF